MAQHYEIADICKSWQLKGAQDCINKNDYESAIFLMFSAIDSIGYANGSKESLTHDEYCTDDHTCVKDLLNNIEKVGFSKKSPVVYAFLIQQVADLYSAMDDHSNGFIWSNKLMNFIEKHPSLNEVDFG